MEERGSATLAAQSKKISVIGIPNLARTIDEAKQNGLFVVGLDGESDVKINEMKVATEPLMIVVGSEGKGLARLTRE